VSIIKTAAYAAWITEAGMKLNRQNPGCVKGPYALTLILQDGLRLDLDNAIKATSDLLQTHGVIENDKLCREIHARWSPLVVGCQVMVTSTRALGIATRESEV
jgi:Holliday junction resolvase RusA-like endonuclease